MILGAESYSECAILRIDVSRLVTAKEFSELDLTL